MRQLPEPEEDHYEEKWIAVVDQSRYILNKKEAAVLNNAISQGRGIVQFKEFIINIPFLKEFYLDRRYLKPEYQLAAPDERRVYPDVKFLTAEDHKQFMEQKKALLEKVRQDKKLSAEAFEKRRAFLLKQGEQLKKQAKS